MVIRIPVNAIPARLNDFFRNLARITQNLALPAGSSATSQGYSYLIKDEADGKGVAVPFIFTFFFYSYSFISDLCR